MALPLERAFGSEEPAPWSERFGNLAAMMVHVVGGGIVLQAVLATPIGQALAAFPSEPRHALLRDPFVSALSSVLIVDAAFFGHYRLQHAVALPWRIHELHHTDPAMNVTTAQWAV